MSENKLATCREKTDAQCRNTVAPALDIYEATDHYTLEVNLPGALRDSIAVDVEQRVLTLSADRQRTTPDKTRHLAGPGQGHAYFRRLRLGEDIDTNAIEADYADGVLKITLPKSAAAQKRSIEIRSAGQ